MMPVHQRVLVERHTYNGCSRRWKGWRAIPVGLRNSSTVGQVRCFRYHVVFQRIWRSARSDRPVPRRSCDPL